MRVTDRYILTRDALLTYGAHKKGCLALREHGCNCGLIEVLGITHPKSDLELDVARRLTARYLTMREPDVPVFKAGVTAHCSTPGCEEHIAANHRRPTLACTVKGCPCKRWTTKHKVVEEPIAIAT